jgi:hypothetical protein
MHTLVYNRPFRRLFIGRLVTNAGDSLYFVAAMWLVWDLTGNEFYSGLAGFLTLAPSGLQFLFGPLVDRWPLRRLLVATQLLQCLLVLAVPAAHLTGHLSAWVVLAVMPTLALVNQLSYPAESAALPRIVDREELVGANSLFALAYQGVDAVFNALAGVLVAVLGAVAVFALDAATFAAAAAVFATVRVPRARVGDEERDAVPDSDGAPAVATDGGPGGPGAGDAPAGPSGYFADLRAGIALLRGTFLVKLLGGSLVVNFAIGAALAVMPSYGAGVAGAWGYGVLMSTLAAGVLAGALGASLVDGVGIGRLSVAAFAASGVAWVAAVAIGWFPGTALLFLLAFVPVGVTNVLFASAMQALVPEAFLGRVSAVLGSGSAMATPFGALVGGAAAAALGPTPVMGAAGAGFLGLALYVAAVPALRRLPAVEAMETLAVAETTPAEE